MADDGVFDKGLFDKLRARGEEVFGQLSGQLMSNPQFMRAMQGALKGKEIADEAVARALKQMNIPTRTEFKRAVGRIEALERELAGLRAAAASPVHEPAAKARPRRRRARKPGPGSAAE